MAYLTPKFFGLASYGVIFGCLLTCVSLSLGLGAVLFGVVHDQAGSYRPALLAAIPAYLSAASCLMAAGWLDRRRGR